MAFDGVRAVQRCGGAEADHLPHSLSPTARPAVSHSMRNMCVVRKLVASKVWGVMRAACVRWLSRGSRLHASQREIIGTHCTPLFTRRIAVGTPSVHTRRGRCVASARRCSPAVREQGRPRRRAAGWIEQERLDELKLMLRQI